MYHLSKCVASYVMVSALCFLTEPMILARRDVLPMVMGVIACVNRQMVMVHALWPDTLDIAYINILKVRQVKDTNHTVWNTAKQ